MSKIISGLAVLSSLLALRIAEAHGEDKPGPHGGQIRMPGPYHTELVLNKSGFKIYLLDINFENPTTKNSMVQASITLEKKTYHLNCKAQINHFICQSENLPNSGDLTVNSVRNHIKGNTAYYQLTPDK